METQTPTATATPELFTRDGQPYTGRTTRDDRDRVGYIVVPTCNRCGGAGGWKGWPGFTCYDCGGDGKGRPAFVPVYTAAKLATLNKAQATRDAKRTAKAAAAEAARVADVAARSVAFEAQHGALLDRAATLADTVAVDITTRARAQARISDKQVAVLQQAIARADERAAQAARSGYVGTVGQRIEVAVTVLRVASFERPAFGSYNGGMQTVHVTTMADAAGNQIVVKSPRFSAAVGDAFTLRATVVEHTTYQDTKQTVAQRAAVVEPKAGAQ